MLPTASTMRFFALLHIGGPYHSVHVTSPRDIFWWHLHWLSIQCILKNVPRRHQLEHSVINLQTRKASFVVWCLCQTTAIEHVNRLVSSKYCYITLYNDTLMIIYHYFMLVSPRRGSKEPTRWKNCSAFVPPREDVFMHIMGHWTQLIPSTHSHSIKQRYRGAP
jgi:hypothetical protein